MERSSLVLRSNLRLLSVAALWMDKHRWSALCWRGTGCAPDSFFQKKKGTSESTAVHSSGPSVAVRGSVVELAADASTGEFSVPFEEGKTCEVTFALD